MDMHTVVAKTKEHGMFPQYGWNKRAFEVEEKTPQVGDIYPISGNAITEIIEVPLLEDSIHNGVYNCYKVVYGDTGWRWVAVKV